MKNALCRFMDDQNAGDPLSRKGRKLIMQDSPADHILTNLQEQVSPMYNAFPHFGGNAPRHLMGFAPHTRNHWAGGQRGTRAGTSGKRPEMTGAELRGRKNERMRAAGPLPIRTKKRLPPIRHKGAAITDEPGGRQPPGICLLYHIQEPGRKDIKIL